MPCVYKSGLKYQKWEIKEDKVRVIFFFFFSTGISIQFDIRMRSVGPNGVAKGGSGNGRDNTVVPP